MTPIETSSSRSPLARLAPYRRPILSFGGAILVGYLTLTPLLRPAQSKIAPTEPTPIVLPASATMIVRPKPAPGAQVEGKIELAADVVGRAPVGGAVARWLVEPGQRVEKGQPVVQISSGRAIKPAPVAEVHQSRAEKAQIEAADNQLELARQMTQKQTLLRAAQERVQKAQTRVADARALISKLQASGDTPPPSAKTQTKTVSNPAHVSAAVAVREAKDAASSAKNAQKVAESEVKSAQKSLADAQKQLAIADTKVSQVERDFDAGKANGGDVQAARSDKEDAQTKLASAQSRLDTAKKDADTSSKKVAPLLAKIESAEKALAQTPETLTSQETSPAPEDAPTDNSAALGQAIAQAQKALEESQMASREAEKLAARVKYYEVRVHSTNQQVEAASEQLQSAQQRVLNSVPRPVFTEASAPQSGTVVWISRLATEVGAGDRVFGVSLGDKYRVQLEVEGDAWKRVKVGDKLPAILSEKTAAPVSTPTPAPTFSATPAPTLDGATFTPGQTPAPPQSVPIRVVVREVNAPETGESATIEGDLEILADSNVSPSDSQIVSAFLPSNEPPKMMIPVSSIVPHDGQNFVAVLGEDETLGDQTFSMKWQRVKLGRLVGLEREIELLPANSRILMQPLTAIPDATPSEGQTSSVTIQTA